MRAIRGLWRWRGNPLHRPTDRAEAWVSLAALLLVGVAAPVIGTLAGTTAQHSLRFSMTEQQHHRSRITATVQRRLAYTPPDADPDTGTEHAARSRVLAGWTAPDGTRRRGAVLTDLKSPRRGDHLLLWSDPRGRITARPLDSTTVTAHAVLAGLGAGLLAAGLVEAGRRLVMWLIVRRRYARWDQAWDRAGPDWGKTGTGS